MSFMVLIRQDSAANRGRPHLQLALMLFRAAGFFRSRAGIVDRLLALFFSAVYRAYALSALSLDIPVSTRISSGLTIHHGMGLVVHNRAVVGEGVTLRQNTTVGSKAGSEAPILADGVDVGANCVILGDIRVGAYAVIGAGAVVTKDVPDGAVAVGNPATVRKRKLGSQKIDRKGEI